jgi:OmpA-OmpF porin, OOP family
MPPAVVPSSGSGDTPPSGGSPRWLIALAVVGALALAGAAGALVALALTDGDDADAQAANESSAAVVTTVTPPLELRVRVEEPSGSTGADDAAMAAEAAAAEELPDSSDDVDTGDGTESEANADERTKDAADLGGATSGDPVAQGDPDDAPVGASDPTDTESADVAQTGAGSADTDQADTDQADADRADADQADTDRADAERAGADQNGSDRSGADDGDAGDAQGDPVAESKAVVRDGQIFLEGAVPTAEAGVAIEALAAEILGPDNVFNDYVVDPRAGDPNLGNITVEDTINFATDSAVVLPEAETLLNQGLALLTLRPAMTIHIVGHTDDRGTAESNHELSTRRAEAVKDWFVERGVDPSRLTTEGVGEDEPIAENHTAEGRRLNRRIQFFLENILG